MKRHGAYYLFALCSALFASWTLQVTVPLMVAAWEAGHQPIVVVDKDKLPLGHDPVMCLYRDAYDDDNAWVNRVVHLATWISGDEVPDPFFRCGKVSEQTFNSYEIGNSIDPSIFRFDGRSHRWRVTIQPATEHEPETWIYEP